MPTAAAYLGAAASEVGYLEQPAGSNRTKFAAEAGHPNGQPWCATFLVAIARRTGLAIPSASPYTPTMANAFRADDAWLARDPRPGDWAFFDFPDSVHRIQHVAVVAAVRADGSLTTIEGNTAPGVTGSQSNGGGVWRRHRARGLVVGYGRPAYDPEPAPPIPTARKAPMILNIKDTPFFFFVRGVASDNTLVLVAIEPAEAWELAAAGVQNVAVSAATFDKIRKAPAWDRA